MEVQQIQVDCDEGDDDDIVEIEQAEEGEVYQEEESHGHEILAASQGSTGQSQEFSDGNQEMLGGEDNHGDGAHGDVDTDMIRSERLKALNKRRLDAVALFASGGDMLQREFKLREEQLNVIRATFGDIVKTLTDNYQEALDAVRTQCFEELDRKIETFSAMNEQAAMDIQNLNFAQQQVKETLKQAGLSLSQSQSQ